MMRMGIRVLMYVPGNFGDIAFPYLPHSMPTPGFVLYISSLFISRPIDMASLSFSLP